MSKWSNDAYSRGFAAGVASVRRDKSFTERLDDAADPYRGPHEPISAGHIRAAAGHLLAACPRGMEFTMGAQGEAFLRALKAIADFDLACSRSRDHDAIRGLPWTLAEMKA